MIGKFSNKLLLRILFIVAALSVLSAVALGSLEGNKPISPTENLPADDQRIGLYALLFYNGSLVVHDSEAHKDSYLWSVSTDGPLRQTSVLQHPPASVRASDRLAAPFSLDGDMLYFHDGRPFISTAALIKSAVRDSKPMEIDGTDLVCTIGVRMSALDPSTGTAPAGGANSPPVHVVRFNLNIHVIKEGVYEWKMQIGEALLVDNNTKHDKEKSIAASAVLKECHRRTLNMSACVEGVSRYMLATEEDRKQFLCEAGSDNVQPLQGPSTKSCESFALKRATSNDYKGEIGDRVTIGRSNHNGPLTTLCVSAESIAHAYRIDPSRGVVASIPMLVEHKQSSITPATPAMSKAATAQDNRGADLALPDASQFNIIATSGDNTPRGGALLDPNSIFKQTRLDSIVRSFAVLFAQPDALDHVTNDEIIHMVRFGHLFVHNDRRRTITNNPNKNAIRKQQPVEITSSVVENIPSESAHSVGEQVSAPSYASPLPETLPRAHVYPMDNPTRGALAVIPQATSSFRPFGLGYFAKLQWSLDGRRSGAVSLSPEGMLALAEEDASAMSVFLTTAVVVNLVCMGFVMCAFMGALALINRLHVAYENSMAVYTENNQRGGAFSEGTPLWAIAASRGSSPQPSPQLLPAAAPAHDAAELKSFALFGVSNAPNSGDRSNDNEVTDGGATDVPSPSRVDSSDTSNFQRENTDTYPQVVDKSSVSQDRAYNKAGSDSSSPTDSNVDDEEYGDPEEYGREESSFTPTYTNPDLTIEAIKLRNATAAATHAFQEDYTIVKKIGNGVDGSVFVVKSKITDTFYAVKAICIAGDADKRKREATLHSKLDDPSIPRFYHTWIEEMPVSAIIEMEMFPDIQSLLDYASIAEREASEHGGGGGGGYAFSMCSDMATDYGDSSENGATHDVSDNTSSGGGTSGDQDRSSTPTKEAMNAEREAIQAARDLREAQLRNATIPVLFIKMEYFRAGTLKDYINERRRHTYDINSPQWKQVAWQLLLNAALGVRYLHQMKIIHRDVKPSNIFIGNTDFIYPHRSAAGGSHQHKHTSSRGKYGNRRGDSEDLSADNALDFWGDAKLTAEDFLGMDAFPLPTLKLGDFGRSVDTSNPDYKKEWLASEESLPHRVSNYELFTDTFCFGTPPYASPEQMSGKLLGFQTDIFSLGIIAIELFQNFQTDHEKYSTIEKATAYDPHMKQGDTSRLPPNMQGQEFKVISSMLSESPYDRPLISSVVTRIREILERLSAQQHQHSALTSNRLSQHRHMHASTASFGCPSAGSSTTTKVQQAFPFVMPHSESTVSLGTPATGTGGTCRFPFVSSMEFDPPSPSAATMVDGST